MIDRVRRKSVRRPGRVGATPRSCLRKGHREWLMHVTLLGAGGAIYLCSLVPLWIVWHLKRAYGY